MPMGEDRCAVFVLVSKPGVQCVHKPGLFHFLDCGLLAFLNVDQTLELEIVLVVAPFFVNQGLKAVEASIKGITDHLDQSRQKWSA